MTHSRFDNRVPKYNLHWLIKAVGYICISSLSLTLQLRSGNYYVFVYVLCVYVYVKLALWNAER